MSRVPPSTQPLPADQKISPTQSSQTPSDYKETFRSRQSTAKYADPCEEASKASFRCLERANYNRKECTDFFLAYRECKKKWQEQRWADRRAGRETV